MDWITEPFQFAFQQRALLGGSLAAISLALVGTWVVIRGMTFLGDALVHGVIPGIALALLLYPITRVLLEFIRTDEPGQFGTPFSISQFVSLALCSISILLWIYLLRRPRGTALPVASDTSRSLENPPSMTATRPNCAASATL